MLRLVSAEIKYGSVSLLAWLAVAAVAAGWPFLENSGGPAIQTSVAFLSMLTLLLTPAHVFMQLVGEKNERRSAIYRRLPLGIREIVWARQLRAISFPIVVTAIAVLLILLGLALEGTPWLSELSGAWLVPSLLLFAAAIALFIVLLYDVGGLSFAMTFSVALVIAGIMLSNFVPQMGPVIGSLGSLTQSPTGPLLGIGAVLSLALLDWLVVSLKF